MAAPTIIASAKNNALVVGSTGIDVTHGLTLVNGDVLYAFLAEGDNAGSAAASSSGGTWTQLSFTSAATGDDRMLASLRRVVTDAASEPATYTFTVNSAVADTFAVIVVQVRGGDTTTPEDATTTTNIGVDDFTPANVTIDTVTNDCLILIAKMCSLPDGVAATKTAGAPSGWNLTNSETFTAGADLFEILLEVADKVQATAGTVTPGNWTSSPDDATAEWATVAIAVKPGASVFFPAFNRPISQAVNRSNTY